MGYGKDEYFLLNERLDEVERAVRGECNDIDCDKYLYKDFLKKRYKPVLEHTFSCMKKLKSEKKIILRILSQKKYSKYRYTKCIVCNKKLDKLDNNKNMIVLFTKLSEFKGKICSELRTDRVHKKCERIVNPPKGWNKGFS
jgi:hypothetical protein